MNTKRLLAGEVFIDVETASEIDLTVVGSDVYFSHPTTRVLCVEAITCDGDLFSWSEGEEVPIAIFKWVLLGWTFVAHGVVFERLAFERILHARCGFPMPEHWACTMMRARYNGLPAALEYAAQALGLPIEKDMAGARLMRSMCRPRDIKPDGTRTWWHLDDPAKLKRLKDYCLQDCKVSQAVWNYTRTPPPAQVSQYNLVARMNKRGVQIDMDFARAAVRLAISARHHIDAQLRIVTRGAVDAASKVAQLKEWITLYGVQLESLDKRDVQRFLARPGEDIPEPVRQAIVLRMEAAKSSVSKYQAALDRANARGRVEDAHVWHGAGTGRLSAQGLQTQNFRREIHPDAARAMQLVRRGDLARVMLMYGEPLELLSTLLRPMIRAQEGRVLVGGDLSQIEARVMAWIAGDARVLDLFRSGEDVYRHTGAELFHTTVEAVTDKQRQAAKVADLAFGFGGALGALQAMARTYNMPAFAEEEGQRLVDTWRRARPLYTNFWKLVDYASKAAILHPGKPWRVSSPADIDFACDGQHLYLRLPSGRLITYRDVSIEDRPVPWGGVAPQIIANGVNSTTRRFERYILTRVILVENIVQAIAADVMFAGLEEADRSNYEPVLSVHDELVCEPPPDLLGEARERLGWMMTLPLPWAPGLPLGVKTWSAPSYLKQ